MADREYSLKKKTFEMFLFSICAIAVVSAGIALAEQDDIRVVLIYLLLAVLTALYVRKVKKSEEYVGAAIVVIACMELFVLPLLFYLDGGMYGPIPIWIAVNIMFCFLFLGGRKLLILLLCMLVEYSYLLSRIYLYPHTIDRPKSSEETFADYILCFMAAVIWIMTVILGQERSFRAEKKKIEESNEVINRSGIVKSHMLERISDDFTAPMNNIIGMAEFLQKEEADKLIRNEILNIKNISYDLLSAINDALIYSRLESGKIVPHEADYYFKEMIESVIDSVMDDIQEKGLHFLIRLAPDIPKLLYGDSRRLREIIMNLLLASVSMTSEGRVLLTVGYEKGKEADEITLLCSVSDTGRGMTQEEIDTVSVRRGAMERVKLKFSVCREYVTLFGGSFSVKSLKDVGTSVSFTVKNRIVDDKPMIALPEDRSCKILIYAESEENNENWRRIMDSLHIEAKYVSNRYRFESAVRDLRYDYIFLSKSLFDKANSIIAYYHCEEYTYVIGSCGNVYGEFGKCRLLRLPLSCIDIARVLNGAWRKDDYIYAHNQNSFTAKGSRILVIDDNFTNLKIAAGIFRKYGVDIDVAFDGEEGLRKIGKERYHLIFVDMHMPEQDGEELLVKIRGLKEEYLKDTAIIAVTAEKGDTIRESLLAKGFQDYLPKPIRIRRIEECMLSFIPDKYIVRNDIRQGTESRKEEHMPEERGLNVRKGISNIGFNEAAYEAILNTYYHENVLKLQNLEDIFRKEELPAFISAVHGIKSTSASIGAMGLSAQARELEYAGKDGNIGYISEKLPLFLKEYQLILEEIHLYLAERGSLQEEKESRNLQKEEEELDVRLLADLKDKLDRMDLKACKELLDEMAAANYGSSDNEQISRIKTAYEHFDFHTAKKVLGELKESR